MQIICGCLCSLIKILNPSRKLIEGGIYSSSKFAVAYCLHDDVCCNEISFMAVTYENAGVAEFIDQTWRSISSIRDSFYGSIFKDGLITAGTFQGMKKAL